jgi:very-short-patch-repair endonuclease
MYKNSLKKYARELRERMTDAEIRLWARLRLHRLNGHRFQRQRIVGNYVVDFYCPSARLVIELDGGQHYSEEKQSADSRRDDYFNGKGLRVLRFSDSDVLKETDAIMEEILRHVEQNPL